MSRASGSFSGGRPTARSASTSTATPPAPNSTIGPNVGSVAMPAISSWAPGLLAIACTMKPSSRAVGAALATRASIASAAASTASGGEVERHAADVGLVGDLGRQDLQRHRRRRVRRATSAAAAGVAAVSVASTGTP